MNPFRAKPTHVDGNRGSVCHNLPYLISSRHTFFSFLPFRLCVWVRVIHNLKWHCGVLSTHFVISNADWFSLILLLLICSIWLFMLNSFRCICVGVILERTYQAPYNSFKNAGIGRILGLLLCFHSPFAVDFAMFYSWNVGLLICLICHLVWSIQFKVIAVQ